MHCVWCFCSLLIGILQLVQTTTIHFSTCHDSCQHESHDHVMILRFSAHEYVCRVNQLLVYPYSYAVINDSCHRDKINPTSSQVCTAHMPHGHKFSSDETISICLTSAFWHVLAWHIIGNHVQSSEFQKNIWQWSLSNDQANQSV